MLITLLIVVFALTMTLGVPIAFCLGLAGLSFIVLSGTVPIAVLPTLMFGGMDSFPLLAIPFFIIAGDLMQRCGVSDPARVAKVGDTPADLAQGHNAGCGLVIGVTSGSHTREQLAGHPHTHLIESVADLPAVLGLTAG